MIGVSVVHWLMREHGWTFEPAPGATGDTLHRSALPARDSTPAPCPHYTGRVTVPVLVGSGAAARSSTTSCPRSSGCSTRRSTASAPRPATTTRQRCGPRSTASTSASTPTVNNGVYRAGFATTQAAYDEAVTELFATLDWLEERLARQRYLDGRPDHRGRLAPVHHAAALRPGLSRPLQVQPAPAGRLPQPVGLHARALPVAGRGRDRRLRAHQGPLLRQPRHHQPDRHRAQGPAARLRPVPTAATRSGLSPRVDQAPVDPFLPPRRRLVLERLLPPGRPARLGLPYLSTAQGRRASAAAHSAIAAGRTTERTTTLPGNGRPLSMARRPAAAAACRRAPPAREKAMRAVIYARYSTDAQREASIEDQVRLCRELAERAGLGGGRGLRRPRAERRLDAAARATSACSRTCGPAASTWCVAEAPRPAEPRPGAHRRPVQAAGLRRRAAGHAWPRARSASCMSASRAR